MYCVELYKSWHYITTIGDLKWIYYTKPYVISRGFCPGKSINLSDS